MAEIRGYPIELPDTPVIWRGDPFSWKLQLGDPGVSLEPFGDTWTCQFRGTMNGTPIDATVDTDHLTDGYVTVHLDGATTAGMLLGKYGFDVQSDTVTLWTGAVTVEGDWTRG